MSDAKRCDRCKGYYDLGATVQKKWYELFFYFPL